MKLPIEHFRHCPACGQPLPEAPRPDPLPGGAPHHPPFHPNVIHCATCDFLYHFNPTVAAGIILTRPDGAALFIRRAKDPERGKLALPGGFIEIGETAEVSLRREILEEVGLEIGEMTFLCSEVNTYDYHSIKYPVLDLFFTATARQSIKPEALDDVAEICWVEPRLMDPDQLAFPSVRAAVRRFTGLLTPPGKTAVIAQTAPATPRVPVGPPPDNRSGQ